MNRLWARLPHIRFRLSRGSAFGGLILTALLFFEVFNYSTTDFALYDLLGEMRFLGIRWATILAVAFCGIDFAGIARIFTPEEGADEPVEVWYLFGAWLLAAIMNAGLTWWGVSVALLNHVPAGAQVLGQAFVLRVVPIFVAVLVFLVRVLIIGTISVAGERLFSQAERRPASPRRVAHRPIQRTPVPQPTHASTPATAHRSGPTSPTRTPEPTYEPMGMYAQGRDTSRSARF